MTRPNTTFAELLTKAVLFGLCGSFAGLLVLPALIFTVGSKLFGVYAGGMPQMYRNLFADLASGEWSAWLLVGAPGLCVMLVYLTFQLTASRATPAATPSRREPTLGN